MKRLLTVSLVLMPSVAWAETVASSETTVPGGVLMLISYLILWVMIVGYLAVLSKRQQVVEEDVETLRHRMDELFNATDDA